MHLVGGKCVCGAVTYEAEIDPDKALICHCTDCQNHSGSAYRVVAAVKDSAFTLLSGALKSYEKLADSGSLRSRTFCPECGTNLYARTWTRSALPWSADLTAMKSFAQQPDLEALNALLEH